MRRNPLIVGFAILAGLGLFLLLVVIPRGNEVASVRTEIDAAQQELAALEADVAALEAAKEAGTAAADLAAIRAALPPTPELPELLAALQAAATEANVSLSSIAPGAPSPSAAGSASVIPLSITVSGDYFALARFLFDLETQPRITRVASVSITGGGESGALAMQVNAEVYTTDLSAGPGSDPAPGAEVGA
ncbi:MAG: type 4a pilus biogenesis protein PilO [Actinomycetota bacterium]